MARRNTNPAKLTLEILDAILTALDVMLEIDDLTEKERENATAAYEWAQARAEILDPTRRD